MSKFDIQNIHILNSEKKNKILSEFNLLISNYSAEERVSWSLKNLPCTHIISSSFGIQSMVLLHMIIKQKPNIPVVLIDTGYLFPETYNFIDFITKKYNLNLHIFRSKISPAWQEARYGKLWKKGIQGIDFYNNMNKVKPMNFALHKLSVQTWFSGLRHDQSKSRNLLPYLSIQKGVFKVLPILDWSNNKVHKYLKKNNLDIHPLSKEGYLSIGDVHTTIKHMPGMLEEETRFFGLKRECGLHED
ncbi:MAG: phosphoadenylyl-sulfate reductase [Buchnera aphidicola (Brevicoryne brassicae)]|uniref:Phosphoadenosine 5'-phosphosulfate reductase n=1 Tax=Buchnera aphidicola (Brevicoryne brassicae) TaxID=911343 RepID=A0AAJ5PU08_9GAMM|nr:phosphoadenylyl-sulfate reductase [Buchnera aphidicola]QCI19980.1 phosphoadenylyl-sulfate reductase [Buchnera aphidicola (Brevicoryne brassicae)]WAI18804.1 MAG: phosphoadenylyl-sulfate reductase [Buchnera aphidicola (Brevicoryne brassicae)]